jgi:hypothetical protein
MDKIHKHHSSEYPTYVITFKILLHIFPFLSLNIYLRNRKYVRKTPISDAAEPRSACVRSVHVHIELKYVQT